MGSRGISKSSKSIFPLGLIIPFTVFRIYIISYSDLLLIYLFAHYVYTIKDLDCPMASLSFWKFKGWMSQGGGRSQNGINCGSMAYVLTPQDFSTSFLVFGPALIHPRKYYILNLLKVKNILFYEYLRMTLKYTKGTPSVSCFSWVNLLISSKTRRIDLLADFAFGAIQNSFYV
jgi:hypothetical protein